MQRRTEHQAQLRQHLRRGCHTAGSGSTATGDSTGAPEGMERPVQASSTTRTRQGSHGWNDLTVSHVALAMTHHFTDVLERPTPTRPHAHRIVQRDRHPPRQRTHRHGCSEGSQGKRVRKHLCSGSSMNHGVSRRCCAMVHDGPWHGRWQWACHHRHRQAPFHLVVGDANRGRS